MDSQTSSDEIIERIREKFLTECEKHCELYDEIDVKRVRTDDYQIERFVSEHPNNEETAYESMARALKWKKTFGVHERTDQYFPKEYFEFSEAHSYGRDREGRLIQWEKNKNERKIPEIIELNKQFIAHIMEKLDSSEHRKGYTLVSDTNGSGLGNINMEIFKFKIELTAYYPEALKSNLVVDLPWVLNSVAKIIVSFCDPKLKQRIHFINRKQLTDFIDPEIIPIDLGGQREVELVLPEDMHTMKQLSHLGLNDKVIQTYYKSFNRKF